MSLSGLTQSYVPNTLDGLNVIDADQIYIDGQLVDLTNYVPYTGADKPVDVGAQPIRTTYAPVAANDVVNLDTLTNAVTFVDNSVALTYLNKITTSSQTVAGLVTFTNGLQTNVDKDVSLASTIVIAPNYPNATVSDGAVTAGSLFGTITSSMGVYQSTSSGDGGVLVLGSGLSTGRVRLVIHLLVNDSNPVAVSLFGSSDGINPYQSITSNTFTPGTTTFWSSDTTFTLNHPYIILTCNTVAPGVGATVQWYGLMLYQMGAAQTNVTMPAQTADRVVVLDGSKRLVASGINTTKLGYLDNVSSDIQTQLNAKLNLSGSNANQNIVLGSYKVQSSATPSTGDDYINKTYGDTMYALASALAAYLPLSGGTMTGNISMGSFKVTSNATPTASTDYITKGYGDSTYATTAALSSYVLKSGDTMTGTLYNNAGNFHAYRGGDTNRGCFLFANDQDGATLSTYNGGLGSWFGIGFYCTLDSTTRFVFNTRDGTSEQTGKHTCVGLDTTNTVSIGISGASASTTAFQVLSTSANHYNGNPSTTYLMSGLSGEIMLSYSTARDATTANLLMGAPNTDISEIVSISGDGTTRLPMNMEASRHTLIGNDASYASRKNNPSTAQVIIKGKTTSQRLLLGSYYTTGEGSLCGIQASDFYSGSDHGQTLLINTIGGNVGIGSGINGAYYDANCKFTINSDYSAGSTGGFCINASDNYDYPNIYNFRIYPYVQSAGNVAYQFMTYNGNTAYNSFKILSTGSVQFDKTIQVTAGDDSYVRYGPNATWGAYLHVGATTNKVDQALTAQVITTNGNLHIDSGYTRDLYLNFYSNLAGQAGTTFSYGTWRHSASFYTYADSTGGPSIIYSQNANAGDAYAVIHLRNNTGSGVYWFLNSSGRSADGGANTCTLRNDIGQLRLQSNSGVGINIAATTGAVNVVGGNPVAVPSGYMTTGSLTIGSCDRNYGWGTNYWNTNTAGLLLECADLTEIAVHDSGHRVASLMAYAGGGRNAVYLGRDMGWGLSEIFIPFYRAYYSAGIPFFYNTGGAFLGTPGGNTGYIYLGGQSLVSTNNSPVTTAGNGYWYINTPGVYTLTMTGHAPAGSAEYFISLNCHNTNDLNTNGVRQLVACGWAAPECVISWTGWLTTTDLISFGCFNNYMTTPTRLTISIVLIQGT